MSRGTLDPALPAFPSLTGLSPSPAGLPRAILLGRQVINAVRTPGCSHPGLGSSGFARRYSRNHSYFLFLRLLRCFSSPGSLPHTMDSCTGDGGLPRRVSPFRDPRIRAHLQLPAAFRSLSRLSSALSAKASTLCPSLLDPLVTGTPPVIPAPSSLPFPFASSVALLGGLPGFPSRSFLFLVSYTSRCTPRMSCHILFYKL